MYRQGIAPLIWLCFPLSSKYTLTISQDRQQTLARCHETITNLGDAESGNTNIQRMIRTSRFLELILREARMYEVERMVKASKYPSGSRGEVRLSAQSLKGHSFTCIVMTSNMIMLRSYKNGSKRRHATYSTGRRNILITDSHRHIRRCHNLLSSWVWG